MAKHASENFGDRRHGGYGILAVTVNPPEGYAYKELLFTQKVRIFTA